MYSMKKNYTLLFRAAISCAILLLFFYVVSIPVAQDLEFRYQRMVSQEWFDRNGDQIAVLPNERGYHSVYLDSVPDQVEAAFLHKEDQWFFWHLGIRPLRIVQSIISGNPGATSTISQQLVKILLGNEQERTLENKINEALHVFLLELQLSKTEILIWYANVAYFGNQVQGVEYASKYYFDMSAAQLSSLQAAELATTLSSPSARFPGSSENKRLVKLWEGISVEETEGSSENISNTKELPPELAIIQSQCSDALCTSYIDQTMNEEVRILMEQAMRSLFDKNALQAAAVVIDIRTQDMPVVIGSIRPNGEIDGDQVMMHIQPRPIGSTLKPFLYAKGFEYGLRPYSLVDDKEYRYVIDSGFAFYPKNYDYSYHGVVDLHYSLSNSLNVPAVKVLEYIGIPEFSAVLDGIDLHPPHPSQSYQLGLALGGLEMDLVSLATLFTALAGDGSVISVSLGTETSYHGLALAPLVSQPLVNEQSRQLVNSILSDRLTGVDQFGLKGSLTLPFEHYAVKTGTSRDYHDSWTVGYTPEVVVAVWVGNAANQPMDEISGSAGAGKVWQAIMEYLYATEYISDVSFANDEVVVHEIDGEEYFGLVDDEIDTARYMMIDSDTIILQPHDGDTFALLPNTEILLKSPQEVTWFVNHDNIGVGKMQYFTPLRSGEYVVVALTSEGIEETISIELVK
jgi:penicillin-binding protein 1C